MFLASYRMGTVDRQKALIKVFDSRSQDAHGTVRALPGVAPRGLVVPKVPGRVFPSRRGSNHNFDFPPLIKATKVIPQFPAMAAKINKIYGTSS